MVRGGPGGDQGVRVGVERAAVTQTPPPPPQPAVSISARECEEGQRKGWSYVKQSLSNNKQSIDLANRNVQAENEKLKKLTEGALWASPRDCGAGEAGEGTAESSPPERRVWRADGRHLLVMWGYLNAAGHPKCRALQHPSLEVWARWGPCLRLHPSFLLSPPTPRHNPNQDSITADL